MAIIRRNIKVLQLITAQLSGCPQSFAIAKIANVVCEFTSSKCNSSYIGKTERTRLERVKPHGYKTNKRLNSHFATALILALKLTKNWQNSY